MDEALLTEAQAQHLNFQKDKHKQGYKIGLEILQATGWGPSVVYDAPLFTAPGKTELPVNWDKLKWNFLDPEDTDGSGVGGSEHEIGIACLMVPEDTYVACLTVAVTGHSRGKCQGAILGTK